MLYKDGISTETLRFLAMVQELAASSGKFLPFSRVRDRLPPDCIVYDDSEGESTGEDGWRTEHRIVLDACLALDHHDIVSYYESYMFMKDCEVRAVTDGEGDWWCEVRIDNDEIVIRDGRWHFV